MIDLKSVLAATDFSTDARHAAQRAGMLCAARVGAQGAVLHVLESSWLDSLKRFVNLPADAESAMAADASGRLDELVAAVRAESGFGLEPRVSVGKVLDAILEASASCDLLALGARGQHPVRDFAIGTTAERVLRQTRKPVLVVKRKPEGKYRRVLVGVDFSAYSRRALTYANAIAPDAELHLMHVFEVPFEGKMVYANVSQAIVEEYRTKHRHEAEAQMSDFIQAAKADVHNLHRSIEHGPHVSTRLRTRAERIDADLVVAGRHGKSLAEHLLLGSVTLHLLAETACDVLVTQ